MSTVVSNTALSKFLVGAMAFALGEDNHDALRTAYADLGAYLEEFLAKTPTPYRRVHDSAVDHHHV